MKFTESKSSTPAALKHTTENNPFFSKARSGVFDPENHSKEPFFSGIHQVQAKLKIHPADDAYEKEADAVADQVVKQVNSPPPVQRKETDEGNRHALPLSNNISSVQTRRVFESPTALEQSSAQTEDNLGLQTKAGEAVSTHNRGLESQLQSARGSGSQLPESTRSRMESGFGRDFSGVRVHTGSDAVQMNRDIGARAFTHGNDIYFNSSEYNPNSPGGDHLLAHELTHTVQQGAAKTGGVQRKQVATTFVHHAPAPVPEPLQQQKATGKESSSLQLKSSSAMPTDSGNGQGGNLPPVNPKQSFLMHTIQRKGGINDVKAKNFEDATLGQINTEAKEIVIPEIQVPDFKVSVTGKTHRIVLPKSERSDKQRDIWDNKVKESFAESLLTNKIAGSPGITAPDGKKTYAFQVKHQKGGLDSYVIGDLSMIKTRVGRPGWDKDGNQENYHVDHQHEFQLGGPDLLLSNMWLLEATANTSSGQNIKIEKNRRITDLVTEASKPGSKQVWEKQPKTETVKNQYQVEFLKAVPGLRCNGKPGISYKIDDIITKGESLNGLIVLSSKEIDELGFSRDDVLSLFTRKDGGKMYKIENWDKAKSTKPIHLGLGANLKITNIEFNENTGGKIDGDLFTEASNVKKYLKEKKYSFDIKPISGVPHSAYIDNPSLRKELGEKLEAHSFSPVVIQDADLEQKGLLIRGKIMPSIPAIEKAGIDLVLNGDNIYLEKVFNTGEFKVPAPFKIKDSNLAIRTGTNGIEFEGGVDFGIDRLGEGSVKAYVNSKKEFGVKGSFEFDKKLFDNAKVEVSYENRQWAVKGTIEIPKGKIKGLKGASAKVNYAADDLSITGAAQLDIPGLKKSDLAITYANQELTIAGALELGKKLPGLKSATGQVQAKRGTDGDWKVKASGTAEPDIPGISSSLIIAYDDGIIDMSASAAFEKGLASGIIQVGVTNRIIGPDGKPGATPTQNITVYGGGKVGIKITPWLKATAGVKLLPSGEIEVLGRIELPSNVEVFPRKELNKNLFKLLTIEIPLFAIPLGPKSLGLVAQINGGLDFNAGIGPGQIQSLFGEIKYNPSHLEQTTLSGGGRFVIPADAGLKLHADLTLGLSVAIASLTGGIEMAASVGLKGEASASVNLNWNPASGLELNAVGEVKVSPRFKFDLNLLARAKLDLLVTELSKEWRYNLAAYEWGPGFDFGLRFPIHYKEGKPFNISFEDIEVIKPNIDILQTAKSIARDIKNKVF